MGGDVTLTTRLIKGGLPGQQGVRYEGPSSLLEIPSNRFFATTGIPVKAEGDVPPEMAYLESAKVASLTNLSRDINLAARNALDAMLDHLVDTYGFTRAEAHVIASIAVDLRIAQLVDMPNVGVTAILPLDVIERPPKR
jgi:formamidase